MSEYTIFLAKPTGGKAGKGCNKTSTFQVRSGNCIVKMFRFKMGDYVSRDAALRKAQAWIKQQAKAEEVK